MIRLNKYGIAKIPKEPRLLPFNRNMLLLDDISFMNNHQHQQLIDTLHATRSHYTQSIIIGDAHMGKTSFIGTPTPEVIRQMEFNRNNNRF